MTFCRRAKNEIASALYDDCCNASHLYGILSFAKNFSKESIVINALDEDIINHIRFCFSVFGIQSDVINSVKRNRTFFLTIDKPSVVDRILADFGYSGVELNYRIHEQNFLCDRCKAAFIAGCFLTGGTVTEPTKGYHLEFSTHKANFFSDFVDLLRASGFSPKISERRSLNHIVYFKDSSQIEDLLTFMGAQDAAMEMMDAKIYKDLVNQVNRRTNCESANIDKIVNASSTDREKISYIFKTRGEDFLPEELNEIAKIRLENPELSLSDIGKMTNPNLTKSGVSHRLQRIRIAADQIKEQEHGDQQG